MKNLLCQMDMLLRSEKDDWELVYFALLTLEKMPDAFPKSVAAHFDIWESLVPCMTNQHAWVKLISTRIISKHLSSLDPIEKMPDAFPKSVAAHFDIWESLVPCMTNQHAMGQIDFTRPQVVC